MATTYEQILGLPGPLVGSNCFGTTAQHGKPMVSPVLVIDPSIGGQSAPTKPTQPRPTPAKPTQPQVPGADASEIVGKPGSQPERPHLSYVQMYEMMNPNKPETAEERAKREKREKSEAALAAVGDSISALSNLWFTSQYAPNAYDPSKGMSATTKERWEKLRQEREARRKEYTDGYFRAIAMDDANYKDERNWRHAIEREKIADERYEVKAAQDKALADLNEKLRQQQVTAAEYKAEQERIKAQYAEENEKLDLGYKQAGIEQRKAAGGASNASANLSNARADYYRNGGSGGKKKIPLTIGDKTYEYDSDESYEKAVEKFAKELGVRLYISYPDGKDKFGKPKYTTARKKIPQLAAEVELKSREQKKTQDDEFAQYEVGKSNEEDSSQYELK